MHWNELSREERKRVCYNFIQSEGFDPEGNEYNTPEDYYNGTKEQRFKISETEAAIQAAERGEICGGN